MQTQYFLNNLMLASITRSAGERGHPFSMRF
jgi:hypothetical protein